MTKHRATYDRLPLRAQKVNWATVGWVVLTLVAAALLLWGFIENYTTPFAYEKTNGKWL